MDLLLSSQPVAVRFFVAFLVVLVLIGVTAWLVRRLSTHRLGATGRGRQPRLAVIDAATVDGRRRLVLIRRDNTEHLLMIGGPTDVVIEPNIVRGAPARESAVARTNGHEAPRATSPLETAWPLQPVSEPLSVAPAPRPRSNATSEPWLPTELGSRARSVENLGGLHAEGLAKRSATDLGAAAPRLHAVPPEPAPSEEPDQNLADMADQLEAALRRAPPAEAHPPVTDALAVPPTRAPVLKTVGETRIEPKFEGEPKVEAKTDAKLEPKPEAKAAAKLEAKSEAVPKSIYDNLEEEMANLLGRSSGKL